MAKHYFQPLHLEHHFRRSTTDSWVSPGRFERPAAHRPAPRTRRPAEVLVTSAVTRSPRSQVHATAAAPLHRKASAGRRSGACSATVLVGRERLSSAGRRFCRSDCVGLRRSSTVASLRSKQWVSPASLRSMPHFPINILRDPQRICTVTLSRTRSTSRRATRLLSASRFAVAGQ